MSSTSSRTAGRCALVAAALLSLVAPAKADYRLTVLHVGDLQSRLDPVTETGAACAPGQRCYGGAARLAARIRAERGRGGNVVVLNTGNALTGPYYDMHKQRAVADALNLVGFDAMTVGERDFVDGTAMLGQFQRTARFPLLGANIDLQRDPHMRDRLYPFLATVVGGEQLALIGYSTEQLIERARPSGVIKVEPIETALRRWIEQFKMMGINKVVAISAAGRERDREIAATIEGLDVVIGTSPEPTAGRGRYLVVHKGPAGQPVLMVQSDAFGRSLGRLDVAFDANGVPKTWQGDALELADGPEDPAVKALVASMGGMAGMPAGTRPVADRRNQPPAYR
jgi:5'-nucleotidase